jgi:hypothetical protein
MSYHPNHDQLVASGWTHTHHEADFEDIGTAESGPCLTGGPAYDEYRRGTKVIYADWRGVKGPLWSTAPERRLRFRKTEREMALVCPYLNVTVHELAEFARSYQRAAEAL